MLKHIQSYLSSLYYISTSDVGNDGVYRLDDDRNFKSPVYGEVFLKELVDIFAYDEDYTKSIVNEWALKQKSNVDLTFFWTTKELLFEGIFPIVQGVAARTIGLDLVPVQPMSELTDTPLPSGQLMYFDVQYSGDTPNQNGRIYEVADNDADIRFNNLIQQLVQNQNNYMLGDLDHPDLDN
jgi:hypothetical protein